MQTPELIEKLEQRGLKVTVKQAKDAIAELGSNPDDDHNEATVDLVFELISQARASGTSKKNGKSTGAAIAKAEQAKDDGKGAMVKGSQNVAKSAIVQSRNQGQQLGNQANREMVSAYLTTRAKGMDEFAASLDEASEAIAAITDDVFLSLGSETEDFLLEGSGSFSLL